MLVLNFDMLLELCMILWVDKFDYVSLIWIWCVLVKNIGYWDFGFYLFFYFFLYICVFFERIFLFSFWKELSCGVCLFEIMNIGYGGWYGYIFLDCYVYFLDWYWLYKVCYFG